MSNRTTNRTFTLSGIVCSTLGHNFVISRRITNHINEFKCTQCGKEVTNTYSGRLESLTVKTKEINTSLAEFFKKKMRRRYTLSHEKPHMQSQRAFSTDVGKQLAS